MATKQILYIQPDNISSKKISILEKINRLNELHDPDLMDSEQLQYYAEYLGYNVDINKGELGTIVASETSETSATNEEKYIRFVLRNLPFWYRIKSTRNAIKIMLYSFGLVGDISQYYTDEYTANGNWQVADYNLENDSLSNLRKELFPTPHFIIWININKSTADLNFNYSNRSNIINAIESIRPANTVFRRLGAYAEIDLSTLYISLQTRFFSRHIRIGSNGSSDYWNL